LICHIKPQQSLAFCFIDRNAESLHEQFTGILDQYTLKSEALVPLIEKQMLATYYKYNEEKDDDKITFEKRLKEIDGDIAWQKALKGCRTLNSA
jgi:hypothetical protein